MKMLAIIFVFALFSNATQAARQCYGSIFGEMYCLDTTPFSTVINTPNITIDMANNDTAEARVTMTTTVLNNSPIGGTIMTFGLIANRNFVFECIENCSHTITAVGQTVSPLFRIKVRVPQDATLPVQFYAGINLGMPGGAYITGDQGGFTGNLNVTIRNSAPFKVAAPGALTFVTARKSYGVTVNWGASADASSYALYADANGGAQGAYSFYSGPNRTYADTRDLRCNRGTAPTVTQYYFAEAISPEGYASPLTTGGHAVKCTLR